MMNKETFTDSSEAEDEKKALLAEIAALNRSTAIFYAYGAVGTLLDIGRRASKVINEQDTYIDHLHGEEVRLGGQLDDALERLEASIKAQNQLTGWLSEAISVIAGSVGMMENEELKAFATSYLQRYITYHATRKKP